MSQSTRRTTTGFNAKGQSVILSDESRTMWVYILRCSNNSLYTGYTNDLQKRYQEHLDGKGAKYTRSFKPILIEIAWQVSDKSGALRIESHIKKLSKQDKLRLIIEPHRLNDIFGTETNILLYSPNP